MFGIFENKKLGFKYNCKFCNFISVELKFWEQIVYLKFERWRHINVIFGNLGSRFVIFTIY